MQQLLLYSIFVLCVLIKKIKDISLVISLSLVRPRVEFAGHGGKELNSIELNASEELAVTIGEDKA